MQLTSSDLMLITGATGLVGSHLAEQARQSGYRVRALCRASADIKRLNDWGVETVVGDLDDAASLQTACADATVVVHCAAKVGDWGATADYRRINVKGTRALLDAALDAGTLKRWIQISSLGVYSGTDHYGTDETSQPNTRGIDGYTLTKVESEQLVCDYIRDRELPGVILRPGFIYGPRDRTVMPRLMEKLKTRKFAYLGNPDKLMNNTFVGNLCEAIWLAIANDNVPGQIFNIRDPRAVTKKEFMNTICRSADYPICTKVVPLPVAQFLSWHMEALWKLLGRREAPLVNSARIKFLGRNLDFCIEKARLQLGYDPQTDFRDAMPQTVRWFVTQTPRSTTPAVK
ncbi:MAG: NAD-dependent epimerase/dehydratase family protein [Fuerstiella sp.]